MFGMNGCYSGDSQAIRQSGFSMIELLITIAVLSIGLLGLAGTHTRGLVSQQSAYHRSQATILAYDIADRMRANTASIDNYLTSFMTLAQAKTAGETVACRNTDGCSAAQMAQSDLFDWSVALTDALPDATGIITVAGSTYTIRVNWDDNRDGSVDNNDPNFVVSFQL